jgi:flagellar hook assembly protein FlgD
VRLVLLASLLFALAAGSARAGEVSMVVRDVPLHGGAPARSLAGVTRFNMVGLHWQGSGAPWFRTRSASGRWSAWQEADDDWGRSGVWRKSLGVWTAAADRIEFRTRGRVTRLREYLLWSPPVDVPARRLSVAGSPAIIPRSGWQADESIRRAPPVYAPSLQFALVHHTVTPNDYSCLQSASIVRGIEVYHVKGNGWNDIGYNFLVDRCGQVFEGRYGGIDKNVVGAHSQGFNTGSVGVAMIGTYTSAGPTPSQRQALVKLLAWRLDVAHVDPLSFVDFISGGNQKFPAGIPVNLRAISGHRDTYFTECPGDAGYAQIPSIAHQVAQTGLPKLYAPDVQGRLGEPIRFTARLSSALPWTVTVTSQSGQTVVTQAGTGPQLDWTWDSSEAPSGQYSWTIAAPNVRPATGAFGGKTVVLALLGVSASPQTVSPNGDGQDDTATVSYTLTQPAQVVATLVNAAGAAVSTLFTDQKAAGQHSFVFAADNVPDGPYTIGLTATGADGKTVTAQAPVTVDRTLASFALSPQVLSPNGDGRGDSLSVTFTLVNPVHATLTILDQAGNELAQAADLDLGAGPQRLSWDGYTPAGRIADGLYQAALVLQEPTGAVTHPLQFAVDDTSPLLKLLSVHNLIRFRLGEDATVRLSVAGRVYTRQAKAGIVSFWLKPVPASLYAIAEDAAGNQTRLSWRSPRRR